MQTQRIWMIAAGILAMTATGPVSAATKVQGNLIAVDDGSNLYNIAKPGKFAFKESKAALGGGMAIQLNLKGIDCPTGAANKCDSTDNVMELTVAFGGGSLETHTGDPVQRRRRQGGLPADRQEQGERRRRLRRHRQRDPGADAGPRPRAHSRHRLGAGELRQSGVAARKHLHRR